MLQNKLALSIIVKLLAISLYHGLIAANSNGIGNSNSPTFFYSSVNFNITAIIDKPTQQLTIIASGINGSYYKSIQNIYEWSLSEIVDIFGATPLRTTLVKPGELRIKWKYFLPIKAYLVSGNNIRYWEGLASARAEGQLAIMRNARYLEDAMINANVYGSGYKPCLLCSFYHWPSLQCIFCPHKYEVIKYPRGDYYAAISDGKWLNIDLEREVLINLIKIRFWEFSDVTYTYSLDISQDETTWIPLRSNKQAKGVETISLAPTTLKRIRIKGYNNHNSNYLSFHWIKLDYDYNI